MTSSNNSLMKPYAKRLAIEAFIKAIMAGLFFGLSLALVVAFISRLVRRAHPHSCLWWVIGATVGGIIVAVVMGIITYKKRFKSNTQKLARRIDALGLQQRVTTMVEFSNDKSYVAKVQREDAIEKVAKLETKQLHIRVPLLNIIICSVMFIITVLLFLLNVKAAPDPIDKVDIPDNYQEQIDELRDYVAEQAEVLRENYPESIEYIDMFEERLNVQIDELVREIKTDIYNAEKDEQSQKELNKHIQGRIDRETEDIEEKVEAEFEIREMIRDIHHIIDYSGAPKDFQEFLYTIVDALELRLAESETLTEKYKDIKETREYILELLKKLEEIPIEEIIEEELLRELGEAIDFYKNPVPDQDGNMPTKVEKEEKIDIAIEHIYEDIIGRYLEDRADRAQAYSEALQRVLTAFEESELKDVPELMENLLLQEAFQHFADGTHGIYVAENNYQDTDVMTQEVTDLAAEEIKKALEELENMETAMEEIVEEMEEMEEQLNEDMDTMDEMIEQMQEAVEESNVDEETKEELQQEIQELQQEIEEIFENYEEQLQEDLTQEEKEQAEQEMQEQLQEAISEMKEKLQEELQQEQEEIEQMEESEEKEEAEENHEEREETTDELTEIMEQAQRELDDAPEPPPEEEQQEQQEEQQAQEEEQQETEEQQESENSGPSQSKVNNEEEVYDPINNQIVPLKNLMTPEYKQTVLAKLADPALSDADRTFLQAYISSLPWDSAE